MKGNKKIILIIPVYNSKDEVGEVIKAFRHFNYDICVIDDGSDDGTSEYLQTHKDIIFLSNEVNMGKGHSLEKGFQYSQKNGYNACITVDADLQHPPEDLHKFIEKYHELGDNSVFLGDRSYEFDKMPNSNRLGNRLSTKWLTFFCGQKINDSQCGYRLYPVEVLKKVKVKARRFGYESEFLIRASREKIAFINVPVKAVYPAGNVKHKSHYKKVRDTLKIIWVFIRCLFS